MPAFRDRDAELGVDRAGHRERDPAGADAERGLAGEEHGAGRAAGAADDDDLAARLLRVAGIGQAPFRSSAGRDGSVGLDIGAPRVDGDLGALALR